MYAKPSKKVLIINILDILRRYSDENHRLSQKDIANILKSEYNTEADRKAIRRNIINLIECGYNIEYSETIRMVTNSKTKNWRKAIYGLISILKEILLMENYGY